MHERSVSTIDVKDDETCVCLRPHDGWMNLISFLSGKNTGGDPHSVTLFGQSAGAASIGFHMISPLSRHLFKRAILQSGSPLMPISLVTDQQMDATAADILSFTECDGAEDAAACLRFAPLAVLLQAQEKVIRRKDDTTFSPSFYEDFLPKHPFEAMREGDFGKDKEVLLGFNRDEGSVFMYFANPQKYPAIGPYSQPDLNVTMSQVEAFATKFMKSQNPSATRNLLKSLYADVAEGSIFNATRTHVGEFFIVCPMIFAADDYAQKNLSVFFYHFTHQPEQTLWSKWVGATHYDEVQFVFGKPVASPESYSKEEQKLSKRMMQAWASFARTGKPVIPSSSLSRWPKYTSQQQAYVQFGARSARIKKQIPQAKCNLWRLTFEVAHSQSDPDFGSEVAADVDDEGTGDDSAHDSEAYDDDEASER